MSKIINTTDLQKNIGKITKEVADNFFIVTSRGRAKAVIVPYFENNDEAIANYLEDFEMYKNKNNLQKRYQKSFDSGVSDLVV